MTTSPNSLIPTRVTELPLYEGTDAEGFVPYIINGRTYRAVLSEVTGGGGTTLRADLASDAPGDGDALVASDDGSSGSLWTTIKGFIAYLRSSAGASIVGFLQSGTGAVTRTMLAKAREIVSVKDFGAVGDGVADDTAAIQAARDFVATATDRYKLVFDAGTYKYSASPNFGVTNMCVEAHGRVKLNYTGTGNCLIFDAGSGSQVVWNVRFTGPFIVTGTSSAQNGVYWRSIHHSKIDCRVAGCGPTYAGLRTEFSVCSEFNVVVSVNEQSFGSAKPLYGFYLSNRTSGEATSANTFTNPIIEGVGSHGIYLHDAGNNTFIGGTSEANTGYGVYVESLDNERNTFINMDCEVNTAGSIYDAGKYNTYLNGLFVEQCTVTGIDITFLGGQYAGGITNSGSLNLQNISYGGTITNTGSLSKQNVFYITGNYFDTDLKRNSLDSTTSVPTATATTVLTLPSAGNFVYNVYAYHLNGSSSGLSGWAVVTKQGSSTAILSSGFGATLTITLSGLNVQVTQTAGVTIFIKTVAQVI